RADTGNLSRLLFLLACLLLVCLDLASIHHHLWATGGDRSRGSGLLAELHRRAPRGGIPISVHAPEGCHHPRNCCSGLFLSRRNVGEFRDRIHWGERRRGWIFRGAGRGALGLRRLERSEHGGGRDTESAAQPSSIADLGRGHGGRSLCSGERGGAVCAARGGGGRL